MKFRTLAAIAAAAAASAVAWKMVKDARSEEDDITLELAGDQVRETQDEQEQPGAAEDEERAAGPQAEEPAPEAACVKTRILPAHSFQRRWRQVCSR